MAQIAHGRRAGQTRSAPNNGTTVGGPNGGGMMLPNGTDLRQVTVLSKADWERIQFQLNRRKLEEEKQARKRVEKDALYEKSRSKVSTWTNTIEGQRKKKLEARAIREAKEEEQRKAVDLEHEQYQSKLRKEAIEKAKTQQYYQTDRVKGFHSALLLTEVLKEREAQMELKKLKEQAMIGQDSVWHEQAVRDREEMILKDQEEARKRIKEAKEAAAFQKAQVNEHLKVLQKHRTEEQIEGEELKKLAVQYDRERKRLLEIQAVEAKQLLSDNFKQREDMKRLKELMQQQEEEEDEECRIFAAAKRKMMKLRAAKEREIHDEKQVRLERIREKLSAQMQQAMDDEDERITRAVEEREAKRDAEERGKIEWTKKTYAEIAKHRNEEMQAKEARAREARRRELEELVVKREADALFARNEEEKRNRRFNELKQLQGTHLKQAETRREKAERERAEALALDIKSRELVEMEEKQFQEYAKRVIDHAEQGGRTTLVLRKAAREGAGGGLGPQFPGKGGIRPSYMASDTSGVQLPHFENDKTSETKALIHGKSDSSKRLGFGWK